MAFELTDPFRPGLDRFDEIIDVRSPSEFALDRLPGALNLPVLDDAERAEVGTTYVRNSRFEARRRGAAIVARNIARHLDGYLAGKPAKYRPLIYCWRGGQRSASMALILRQIGWQAETLDGGYRSYRRLVVRGLYDTPFPWRLRVLDGNTGCGKTELLAMLAARDVQTLDLEALANHRGSLFGEAATGTQPSQKLFESRLAEALGRFETGREIIVEAESSTIGRVALPPALWQAMQSAPRVYLRAGLRERAEYLVRTYGDICNDTERLLRTLDRLVPLRGRAQVEEWRKLANRGDFVTLAGELMRFHYDPAYEKSRGSRFAGPSEEIVLQDLKPAGLRTAAERIGKLAEVRSGGYEPAAGERHAL